MNSIMFEWNCRVVASLIFPGITRKIDIECVVWSAQTFQKTTVTQVQAFLAPEWVAWKISEDSDTTERLHFHFSLSCIGEGNGNPLQCSCLENPRDGGSLVGCRLWGRTELDTTEMTNQKQQQGGD